MHSVTGGRIQGQHTIGPLWGVAWGTAPGASDSKTRACLLLALQPRSQRKRQIWEDKEMLPLTVDGLFLEMGRLFSLAAL